MTQAYPLQWPAGWPRTVTPRAAAFKSSFGAATQHLLREARSLGGRGIVLSSNLFVSERTGLPLAKQAQPRDAGVAIYFELKGKPICIACDRWMKVEDNIRALGLTIEAMRGVARWGATDLLDRMFSGFAALPAADEKRPWYEVLGVPASASLEHAQRVFRQRARWSHPDAGGSNEEMVELNAAMAEREAMG